MNRRTQVHAVRGASSHASHFLLGRGGAQLIFYLALVGASAGCESPTVMRTDGGGGRDVAVQADAVPDSPVVDARHIPSMDSGPPPSCDSIAATIRDFDVSHSDFEREALGLVRGLVEADLGPDGLPVYAHGSESVGAIEDEESFAEWYRSIEGTNFELEVELPLREESPGTFVFESESFFPVDGLGFGYSGMDSAGARHNFHFTTELRTAFVYKGGEVFTFRGDDDIWLFIDGRLVIDLGGVHGVQAQTVALDELGLEVGERYALDIFHAERHTTESNFRIETTIECFVPLI